MLGTWRNLPEQPLAARRRFVIVATAFSFTLIILVWAGLTSRRWRGAAPTPSPTPTADGNVEVSPATPAASIPQAPSPPNGSLPNAEEPSPTPTFDVGQLSTSLLKVFAPSEKPKSP